MADIYAGTPPILEEAAAGYRNTAGEILAYGYLSWTESSGVSGATGLYRDPELTQILPATVRLGARGEVVAYGRGKFTLIVDDVLGSTIWTYVHQLGNVEAG